MATQLDSLQQLDYRHLWHPYTDIEFFESSPHFVIERGEGTTLHTADGRALLDGIASWWAVAWDQWVRLCSGPPGVLPPTRCTGAPTGWSLRSSLLRLDQPPAQLGRGRWHKM